MPKTPIFMGAAELGEGREERDEDEDTFSDEGAAAHLGCWTLFAFLPALASPPLSS